MAKLIFAWSVLFLSWSASAGSIVVLGDSISSGYGIDVDRGWVKLLQKKLDNDNQHFTIHNESISGDTTAGGLARIDRILTLYKPDIVLVELGANDGLRGLSPKIMQANLAEIIRRTQQTGAKVLLLSMRIPPNYGKRYTDMFDSVYPQLAKKLAVPSVPFILEEVVLQDHLMQIDGLHPNKQAQPFIAEKVWQYLVKLIEQ